MTTASTIPPGDSTVDIAPPRAADGIRRGTMLRLKRYFTGPVALSILDQAIISGASFLTTVLIGRACSQGDLGVYSLAMSIILLVRAVQNDIVCSPYMIYCHRHAGDSLATYTGSSLVHQVILTMMTLLGITALLGLRHAGVGPAALLPTTYLLLGVMPFVLLREFARNLAYSHLRIGAAVGMDFCVAVVQLGSLAWLFYGEMLTVERAYLVLGLTCGLGCCCFLGRRPSLQFEMRRVRVDWFENWSFAKWALCGQLSSRAAGYIMPWVIASLYGEAATGVFAACVTLINMAGTFVTGMSNSLTPRAAQAYVRGGVGELQGVLSKTCLIFALTIGAFFVMMLAAGGTLAGLVYGAGFAGTGPLLAVLAFGMLANSLGLTAGNGLWALDRAKANFLADIANLIVTFGVLLGLSGSWGILGAATAMTAGFIAGAVVRWLILLRIMAAIRAEHSLA